MKLRVMPVLYVLFAMVVLWGMAGWVIAKTSKPQFDKTIEVIAEGRASDFFEVELLSYEETLYGSFAELAILPTSPILEESSGDHKILLNRNTGPIFINTEGVQIGWERWELTLAEPEDDVRSEPSAIENTPKTKPIGSFTIGFFGKADIRLDVSALPLTDITFDRIVVEGSVNTDNLEHEISVQASALAYRVEEIALSFPSFSLVSKQIDTGGNVANKVVNISVDAPDAGIVFKEQSEKIPFNMQSHGSVWLNNDTLSSDWQSNIDSGQLLKVNEKGGVQQSDYLQMQVNLQLRDLLADGFWQYLNNQSEIYSLFQQAEWAMEEVETPEQQDFLRSLFLDADRIQKSQRHNPLKPLLIADRSQLMANVIVSNGDDGLSSRLSLNGTAVTRAKSPELPLRGEVKLVREMLTKRWTDVLNKWSNRRWFRQYEKDFESDITIRNERLLLNDIIVPIDRLNDELSRALADQ